MQGGSLSPSYTRILALHLYSLFFPTLTSRIVYLSSSNSGPGIFRGPKDNPAPQSSALAYPANRSLPQHGRSTHRHDDDSGSDHQPVSPPRSCLCRPIVLLLRLTCCSLGGPSGLFFLLGFLRFSHDLPLCYGLWSWWLLPSKTSIA